MGAPMPAIASTAAISARVCRLRRLRRASSITPCCGVEAGEMTAGNCSQGGSRSTSFVTGASINSIIHNAQLDRSDRTPLHDQVAAQVRRSIAEGDARPGDRLPPAKDIAAVLGINTNTVLRALRQLRDEGLLEFRRGLGVRVVGTPERSQLTAKAGELLALARHHGYRRDELIKIIQRLG
jgi:DNA-binding transcriptional regulator YhcF (GntR family)